MPRERIKAIIQREWSACRKHLSVASTCRLQGRAWLVASTSLSKFTVSVVRKSGPDRLIAIWKSGSIASRCGRSAATISATQAVMSGHGGPRRGHYFARILCVLYQSGYDVGDGDRAVIGVPAIVIGHHGHGDITDLRFARQLGFLQVGHADHV